MLNRSALLGRKPISKTSVLFAFLGVIATVSGCSVILGIDALPDSNGAGNDGGTGDGSSGNAPTHAADSIAFEDENPAQGAIAGHIVITKASDESDLTQYDLYWGASATQKLTGQPAITSIPKNGSNLTFDIPASPPSGATNVLVFTANGSTEMATGAAATIVDNYPVFADLSAGEGANSGNLPVILVDATNQKLLVVSQHDSETDAGTGSTVGLSRCNLDGSNCSFVAIAGSLSSKLPSAVIDTTSSKLDVVSLNPTDSAAVVTQCDVADTTGASCNNTDLETISGAGSGTENNPTILVDPVLQKIDVIAQDDVHGSIPVLLQCDLDVALAGCARHDLTVGTNVAGDSDTGLAHSAVIDTANQNLLVAVKNSGKLGLFSCQLDGTACNYIDVSLGKSLGTSTSTSLLLDANGKLDIFTDYVDETDLLIQCTAAGAECQYQKLSNVNNVASGQRFSAVFDTLNNLLWLADSSSNQSIAVDRCNADGTSCATTDLSAGKGAGSGLFASAAIDSLNHRLLVGAQNQASGNVAGLYSIGLW